MQMALIVREADTHARAHIPASRTKARALVNTTIYTAHNSTFLRMDKSTVSSSTFNSSEQHSPSADNVALSN